MEQKIAIKDVIVQTFPPEQRDAISEMLLNDNAKLESLDFNSIQYIKIIVSLEDEFDVQFDDDTLQMGYFQTLSDIANYIANKA